MAGIDVSTTTPATRWKSYLQAGMPVVFTNGRFPKALFSNESQTVTIIDSAGEQVAFIFAAGVPIQVRAVEIVSISGASIIALFD